MSESTQTGVEVRCPSCHRQERWQGGTREVVVEGGSRRPAGHPHLVAWNTLRAAIRGESGPVVGSCPGCEQPLVALGGDLPWAMWTLTTPTGTVVVREGKLPLGSTVDQLDAQLTEAWGERFRLGEVRPGLALFQGGLMTLMLVPLVVWVMAALVVSLMIYTIATDPTQAIPGMGQGVTLP